MEFICDIGTVQSYIGKWGEMWISAMVLPQLWQKVKEMREKWCDGREREKKVIMAMWLPK